MARKSGARDRGKVGRVLDVRFVEAAFEGPVNTRMAIELEGGLRLLLSSSSGGRSLAALTENRKGARLR